METLMSEVRKQSCESEESRGERFMHLYSGKERCIFKYIYTLVHNEAAAEDILQETTQAMWTKFDEFEMGTNFVAWALRIAHYRVLKHWASQTKGMIFNSQLVESLAQRAQDHIQQDSRKKMALRRCMKKLPERDMNLIKLRYQEGASVKKVAEQVSRGIKGVYKSLNRIRWQLLECIQRSLVMEDRS
jgi:RNA polymerase sigma-70 factor (ECF subfamily)